MNDLIKRVEKLKTHVKWLREARAEKNFRYMSETQIIIAICELEEEIEMLQNIIKDNRSLFR